jgi:hypothetical protein
MLPRVWTLSIIVLEGFLLAGCGVAGKVSQVTATRSLQAPTISPGITVSATKLTPLSPPATTQTTPIRTFGFEKTPLIAGTPTPTNPIPVVTLIRQTGGVYSTWHDDILDITFDIPVSWGTIEPGLFHGDTGWGYYYTFSNTAKGNSPIIEAGGRSADFVMGRGSTWSDFSGYAAGDASNMCVINPYQPSLCKQIQPNVALYMRFPSADFFCERGPGSVGEPVAVVEINLAESQYINGFVFVAKFLSPEMQGEIAAAGRYFLRDLGGYRPEKCDADSQAAYNQWMDGFVSRVHKGDVDRETALNLDRLEHLARSIVFR